MEKTGFCEVGCGVGLPAPRRPSPRGPLPAWACSSCRCWIGGGLSAPIPFWEYRMLLSFPPETGGEEGQGFRTFFLVFLD